MASPRAGAQRPSPAPGQVRCRTRTLLQGGSFRGAILGRSMVCRGHSSSAACPWNSRTLHGPMKGALSSNNKLYPRYAYLEPFSGGTAVSSGPLKDKAPPGPAAEGPGSHLILEHSQNPSQTQCVRKRPRKATLPATLDRETGLSLKAPLKACIKRHPDSSKANGHSVVP